MERCKKLKIIYDIVCALLPFTIRRKLSCQILEGKDTHRLSMLNN